MNIFKKIDTMSENEIFLRTMQTLNLIIVAYVAAIPAITQIRAAETSAVEFLSQIESLPMAPRERFFLCLGIYLLLCGCFYLKKHYYDVESNVFFFLSIYEIILAAFLMVLMDMAYTGIIFLLAAEYLSYIEIRKNWIYYMVAAFMIYLACNHNLVSIIIPFNRFEVWASFYSKIQHSFILGIKTIGEIVNTMFFLIYVALMVQRDKAEKKQIRQLNEQLKQVNNQLRDANEQLHEFALEKEQMGEMKERNRLAREIHDTLGHILTGISVGIEAVLVLFDIAPDAAKEKLESIGEMSRNGLNDVRRSVRKLKPDSLESKSIDLAIHQMADEMSRTTGTKIYFVSYGSGLHYEADEEETIYRMVQEGTTNAIRHGNATEVWIRLDKKDNDIEISIVDNGSGCPGFEEGFGLTHMRERVEMLSGSIHFASKDGFEIHASIPIRNTKRQEVQYDKSIDS